jgi:Transcription factor WhiB
VPDTALTRRESFAGVQVSHRTGCLGRERAHDCFAHPRAGGSRAARPHPERGGCPAAVSAAARPVPRSGLVARVIRYARCADSTLDPDQWFPVSAEADKARHEAAAAITVCTTCLVRTQCLELSLRHWDIGQHGVWGGLVPADRAALRRRKHPSTIRPVLRP